MNVRTREYINEGERRAVVLRWINLRTSLGATEAARAVEMHEEETLRVWAKKLGVGVPPVNRSVGLVRAFEKKKGLKS